MFSFLSCRILSINCMSDMEDFFPDAGSNDTFRCRPFRKMRCGVIHEIKSFSSHNEVLCQKSAVTKGRTATDDISLGEMILMKLLWRGGSFGSLDAPQRHGNVSGKF